MTVPAVHALVILGLMCLVGAVCCGLDVLRERLARRDDGGHLPVGVAWGLAAEGLVAAVVWAMLR